jgi:NCAIR mutase (PurE)-related protein
MWEQQLQNILERVKQGEISLVDAQAEIKRLISHEMDFAEIDAGREVRTGFPEVIFCKTKTDQEILAIAKSMHEHNPCVLLTRAQVSTAELLKKHFPRLEFYPRSGCITLGELPAVAGRVSVVSAGTSDIPISEEAMVTAMVMGAEVKNYWDIGVAGIHRLFAKIAELRASNVVIAVAGMDGALPGVIAGLVSCPVIAVPTSVGYGASFQGLAPLLTMLNACAPGVTVVNIDNGFGAGYAAALITRKIERK